jgi:hypothetical protein
MGCVRGWRWAFVVVALEISGLPALGDDTNYSRPVDQVRFDRLIPTSYPTIRPSFRRLRPTTYPVIRPGIARVPITKGLINPLTQPLLIVNTVSPDRMRAGSTRRSERVVKTSSY